MDLIGPSKTVPEISIIGRCRHCDLTWWTADSKDIGKSAPATISVADRDGISTIASYRKCTWQNGHKEKPVDIADLYEWIIVIARATCVGDIAEHSKPIMGA